MVPSIFRGVTGIMLALAAFVPATAAAQEIKVTLLGTGCPPPVMNRFGPSILVEAGGEEVPLRCGSRRSTTSRAAQSPMAGCGWLIPHAPSLGSRGWLSGSVVDGLARGRWTQPPAARLGSEGNQEDDVAP